MRTTRTTKKKRIAIVGGGVGGIGTAFQLTSKPGWHDEYEIDIYQLGWRNGGKGASGRNAKYHDRIEEHGLHIWMGFYFNAFRMIDAAYQELNRPPGAPLRTTWDAFKPHDFVVWEEYIDKNWVNWPVDFPHYSQKPTEGEGFPSPLGILVEAIERALGIWNGSNNESVVHAREGRLDIESKPEGFLGEIMEIGLSAVGAIAEKTLKFSWDLVRDALERLKKEDPDSLSDDVVRALTEALRSFLGWLAKEFDESALELDADLHRIVVTVELALVTSIGMLVDGVLWKGFDCIDEWDFVEWLGRHGGTKTLVDSAPIRAIYDMLFSFEKGEATSLEKRNMAAGVALRGCFRMTICYYGSIFWKMQAGMGDTVFAPLYEVLKKRGVRFHFFHDVKNIGLSEDGKRIGRIDIDVQATTKSGGDYEPLYPVEGLPCWPSEPLYDQLVEGDAIRDGGFNLETFWTAWKPVAKKTLLVDRDFDQVVLAVPPSCFANICPELLVADARFQGCADRVLTVQTQASQLWIDRDLNELGWKLPSPVMTAYVEPLDTWADMTHLLVRETWPPHAMPKNCAYFCGPLSDAATIPPPSDHHFQRAEDERAYRTTLEFLERDSLFLWPNAGLADDPKKFDFEILHDQYGGRGEERLRSQYYRANVSPTERYVLSPKGATKDRLSSNEVYFENLFVAGDWTKNGLNAGCVESGAMSSMQCSRAISGFPAIVIGEGDFPGPTNVRRPVNEYVFRDNDTTLAGAIDNKNARLTSFVLRGDRAKLQRTLDQSLNKPALGQDYYVALSDFVGLTQAHLPKSFFPLPEYRKLGWAPENDWIIFVPTLVLKQKSGRYFADRLGAFVYGCLVDQPYALTTGREVFGFPKTFAIFSNDGDTESASTWVLPTFSPDTALAQRNVIEIKRTLASDASFESATDALKRVLGKLSVSGDGRFYLPDLDFWVNSLEDLFGSEFPLFLLKQTRSCAENDEVVYQAILECNSRVTHFSSGGFLPEGSSLTFSSFASQPYADALGLPEGPIEPLLALELEVDFTIETASRIWDRASKQ